MAVGVAEVGATATPALVDLALLPAGGVGVVGDAPLLDAGEGGVEVLLADQEGVVVGLEASALS